MVEEIPTRVRTRAGGRSEQVRRAVGEATLALLSEGNLRFTMVEVAERAGVGRRTVYRWWPTQGDLLIEALATHVRTVPAAPDTGSWAGDLRELARSVAEFASDPIEIAIATIMAGREHPTFNSLVISEWEPAMSAWRAIVQRAINRGEVDNAHDPATVINTLLGPVFLAPLMLGQSMHPAEADKLVDLLLSATLATPAA